MSYIGYIGYPVEFEEVQRLCSISPKQYCSEYKISENLKAFLTDKGQWIIGESIEIGSAWELNSVDNTIILMMETRTRVRKNIQEAKIDLSMIKIYPMEEKEKVMSYPEPFFVLWTT